MVGVWKPDKYIFHHHTQYRSTEAKLGEKQSEYFMVEERLRLLLCVTTIVLQSYYNRPAALIFIFPIISNKLVS